MAKKERLSFDRTRLSIIDASMQLISQKGIAETSLADIARAVKMSKGTLYYYFPSKEHLVHAIAEYLIERMNTEFIAWMERISVSNDPMELPSIIANAFVAASTTVEARIRLFLLAEAARGDERLQSLFQTQYRHCRTLLEMGALKAFGVKTKAQPLITWLIPVLDGICLQQLVGLPCTSKENIEQLMAVMISSLDS